MARPVHEPTLRLKAAIRTRGIAMCEEINAARIQMRDLKYPPREIEEEVARITARYQGRN